MKSSTLRTPLLLRHGVLNGSNKGARDDQGLRRIPIGTGQSGPFWRRARQRRELMSDFRLPPQSDEFAWQRPTLNLWKTEVFERIPAE